MRDSNDLEKLIKQALKCDEPNEKLLTKTKFKMIQEEHIMRKSNLKRVACTAMIAVLAVSILSLTALAAWNYLKPSDVAKQVQNDALSSAFNSDTAININKSVVSGGFKFTFMSVVSGKDITDWEVYSNGEKLDQERTYAVLAIENEDGTAIAEDFYDNTSFCVTPLIKGVNPWQANIITMNGGYSEILSDGVLYRIIECDGINMFADMGVYLAVCDSVFINNETFLFDQSTGEISVNPEYDGASAVFDLPIDKSLADNEQAQAYLDNLLNPTQTGDEDIDSDDADALKDEVPYVIVQDEDGDITFEMSDEVDENIQGGSRTVYSSAD